MLTLLLLPVLTCLPPACLEPDGSRTLGIVPPYHAEPAPPPWLRATSHALALGFGRTRHYLYEAYADGCGGWLVRYRHFPGEDEVCAQAQVAFLFSSDPMGQPQRLKPADIRIQGRNAQWRDKAFVLVDRRDLVTVPAPRRP